MTIETSHGKPRVTLARTSNMKDHADGANAVDPRRNHEPNGRFKKANDAAKGSGAVRQVRALVPMRGRRIYDMICRELGAASGTLTALIIADHVRHILAAADLDAMAQAKGYDTEEGAALLAKSQRCSELAQRTAVAALDTARLLKHPKAKAPKAKGPRPGFEE